MRLSWSKYALNLATEASKRSEDPHVQVGACALSKDNRVLGVAYNGLVSGKNVTDEFWTDRDYRRKYMIHAETNLLSLFERGEARLVACTLLPCGYCARMICAWQIPEVVYRDEYDLDREGLDIFEFYGVKVSKII
ncbi:MAG: deoxycytidylate deaminase [Proteobacteria bacterium]|nr:deoxycytidylate deaminase [Pseudomonadota bacterium]